MDAYGALTCLDIRQIPNADGAVIATACKVSLLLASYVIFMRYPDTEYGALVAKEDSVQGRVGFLTFVPSP